ncbi:MAG: MTH1187 family thiamine-binding protein [Thaumarchaeota archaeon]|nr:MTH1187 family thiamine-binding protein [Nitrososphaerota archaeon]MDE1866740.1 MTH1187 family thiamine-binding protein [Nitrososphaerota archaeon]
MTKIHAELGVLPIGTSSPSLGKYIANGVKSLEKIDGIRYQVTPMGTMIESDDINKIFEASKAVANSIFAMGVTRVETILKIDERRDKDRSLEDKLKSIKKFT